MPAWREGELRKHFLKHGWKMGLATEAEYDASARRTIELGQRFTYVEKSAFLTRVGYFHRPSGRFTVVTEDGSEYACFFTVGEGTLLPISTEEDEVEETSGC